MDDMTAVYAALACASAEGVSAALATVVSTQGSMPRHVGTKMVIYADGQLVGTIGGGAMEAQVIALAQQVTTQGIARTQTFTLNSLDDGDPGICGGSAVVFVEPIQVALRLIVIGGGHVGKALAELGKWMGYHVTLCDDRAEFASAAHVSGLDQYIVCAPAALSQHISITEHSYVCAVTRGLPIDIPLLPVLLQTPAAYIGLIGSRRRWALTRKTLSEQYDLSEADLRRVHAPIGLEIGAETPHEIALSILADITRVRRGGDGRAMQWHGADD